MKIIRDILSVVGCISLFWFLFTLGEGSTRAMVQGLTASIVGLIIVFVVLKSDISEKARLMRKIDQLDTKVILLESALEDEE